MAFCCCKRAEKRRISWLVVFFAPIGVFLAHIEGKSPSRSATSNGLVIFVDGGVHFLLRGLYRRAIINFQVHVSPRAKNIFLEGLYFSLLLCVCKLLPQFP